MRRLAPLLLVFALGCSSDIQEYMPLGAGNKWEYVVRTDGDETTQTIRTVRSAPVGEISGWLLESQMGAFRLGWDGDVLLAAELPDSTFSPPVPILSPRKMVWSGTVATPAGRFPSTARLVRVNERLDVGGRQYQTIKTVLTLESDSEKVQLTTWFFPRMGILRQEQRRGPGLTRDRFVEFVGGP